MLFSGKSHKSLFVQVLCCAGLSGAVNTASASDTRTVLLAVPAGLDDSSMIFTYPGLAAEKSLVAIELGRPANTDVYGGGLYSSEFGTVGLYVSRDASLMQSRGTVVTNSVDLVDSYTQPFYFSRKYLSVLSPGPARPLDLLFAKNIGPGALGVRLTWAGDHVKSKTDAQTNEATANQLDLQLGYSAPVAKGKIDSSLRVGILGTIENKAEAGGNEVKTTYTRGISLKADLRYVQPINANQNVYGKTGIWIEAPNVESKNAGATQDKDISEMQFDAQAGVVAKPRPATTLAAGGAFFYSSSKGPFALGAPANSTVPSALSQGSETLTLQLDSGKSEKTAYGLLGTVGIETGLTERWFLLAGLAYPLVGSISVKDKVTAGNPSYELRLSDVPDATLWAFGVAYSFDHLRIDAGVNAKGFLHNGPQFITGNQTAAPVYLISGTYDFNASTVPVAALN